MVSSCKETHPADADADEGARCEEEGVGRAQGAGQRGHQHQPVCGVWVHLCAWVVSVLVYTY